MKYEAPTTQTMVDIGKISASAGGFAVTLVIHRKHSKATLDQHCSQILGGQTPR
jgi:hypothetical protein